MTSKEEQKKETPPTPTVTQVPPPEGGRGIVEKVEDITKEAFKESLSKKAEKMAASPETKAQIEAIVAEKLEQFKRKRDELRKMLGEGFELTSWKGLKVVVPAIKGKVEKKAIQVVLDLFINNPKLIRPIMAKVGKGEELDPADVLKLILEAISSAYDSLQHLAAILLHKDVKWVDENLMMADLLAVARPFLTAEVEGIMEEVKKMRNPMGAMKALVSRAGSASSSD